MTLASDLERLTPLQRAVLALKQTRAQLDVLEAALAEPIAVIGIGCRFPGGADSPERFRQLLREGRDVVTEVPRERWDLEAFYDPEPGKPGKTYSRWGAFLRGIDRFDPRFFRISPREAAGIDPQQRLLLEVAWESLEHAGQAPERLFGKDVGVFIGLMNVDYVPLQRHHEDPARIDSHSGTGNGASVAAGRLSYFFGWHGPSLAVDTACSSSLVAVHLACQALRGKECDLALAGGVNLILSPVTTIMECQARMLSRDGRCKTFDAAADGFVRGEGCGLVVLRRLSDALAQGDNIMALIRGSAVNQDGRSGGLTAPNGPAQEKVLRRALASGRVQPAQVSYVECHGTGTALGDPVEVRALHAVLNADRPPDRRLLIGSVKTNLGHLEAAAGIAGLIKVVLALHHEEIPPHLHFRELNAHIAQDEVFVSIPPAPVPWPRGSTPRLAGVSAFGFSGTNAHVILGEGPLVPAPPEEPGPHVVCLSAQDGTALRELAERYVNYLRSTPASLADVAWTTRVGRTHFGHRLALVAASCHQAADRLAAFLAGEDPVGWWHGEAASRPGSPGESPASLEDLAAAYVAGTALAEPAQIRHRVPLPTYPFQRQSYWVEAARPGSPTEGSPSPVAGPATQASPFRGAPTDLWRELMAEPAEMRQCRLRSLVRQEVAEMLGIRPPESLDPERGFADLGMDSLLAMDVHDRLQGALGHPLAPTVALNYPTVNALAAYLEMEMFDRSRGGAPLGTNGVPAPGQPAPGGMDVEAALLEELDQAGY